MVAIGGDEVGVHEVGGIAGHSIEPVQLRKDAAEHRQRILDTALNLFMTDPDAGMVDVARSSGLARSTVYAHFPTREMLLRAVFEDAMARVASSIEEAHLDEGSATDALLRVVDAAYALGVRYRLVNSAVLSAVGSEEFRSHRAHDQVALVALFERGQCSGEFTSSLPATWLAAVFDGILFSMEMAWRDGAVPRDQVSAILHQTFLTFVGAAPGSE